MNSKYDIALKNLECNEYSTLEEIKYSFRKFSKLYHPDLNPSSSKEDFIIIKESYDFLILNHKPKVKIDINKYDKYYRILNGTPPFVIDLPMTKIETDIMIYCMINDRECRIFLNKNKELPIRLKINNIGHPFEVIIKPQRGY